MQSFHPDEQLTPKTAHRIALRFAEENFPGFEVLVATHIDRGHIHSHFVLNSVNAETGYKYHSDNNEIQRLRDASDKLCMEYGLSVIVPKSKRVKGMSTSEYHVAEKGESWKLDLAMSIDEVMKYAVSKEHFIRLMEMEGYEVNWKDTRKYVTYTCPNGMRCRDIRLHEEKYLKEVMEDEFRIRKKITERTEGSNEDEYGQGSPNNKLYGRAGEIMESSDRYPNSTDRHSQFDTRSDEGHDNMERYHGFAGGTNEADDRSYEGDRADVNGVSGDSSGAGGENARGDSDHGGELPITGWEDEREFLTAALLSGGNDETEFAEDDHGFAYSDYPADHLGIDSAYVAADMINIIDNDSHTEDCTTIKQPPKNKKNNQSNGFNMSM